LEGCELRQVAKEVSGQTVQSLIHENSNNYCLRLQVTCFEALLSLQKHV
jgi:hypothetical protein